MCNNPCEICGDFDDCEFTHLKNCLSYAEAAKLINNNIIKREDKSYNDYIKEYFLCQFHKRIN